MIRKNSLKLKSWLTKCPGRAWGWLKGIKYVDLIKGQAISFSENVLMPFYPLMIFIVLLYLMTSPVHAGLIRTAAVSENRPVIVHLARGRRTAIQFWIKPEKVVPGSPGKVQIDFLGDDIAVSPLASDPGNLLVYTHGSRFVVLFQMSSESSYDDVVKLIPEGTRFLRPIRLDEDTYHAASFKFSLSQPGLIQESILTVLIEGDGTRMEADSLGSLLPKLKRFQCGECLLTRKADATSFYCTKPETKIECHGAGGVRFSLQGLNP